MNTETTKILPERQKIAVVGSGISGIASAWFLSQNHDVTLFEKNDYIGGHTHTVEIKDNQNQTLPVDTGFIVYNEPNYPLLTEMFKYLNIETINTEMSFAVSIDNGKVEYSGNNLNTLFAQRRNLLSVTHWNMISDIVRFNRRAKQDLAARSKNLVDMTLEHYLEKHKMSPAMRDYYLLPMAAAIWSCPTHTMLKFPVLSFLQFFENHGLLNIENRPQWQTVARGSIEYLKAILKQADFTHLKHTKITQVTPDPDANRVKVTTEHGESSYFDQVVLASHANESYQMIAEDYQTDFCLLQAFQYQKNTAFLHSDSRLMPCRKNTWAAWNYLREMKHEENRVAVTYWMNLLQSLKTETSVFVTLNPIKQPDPDKTFKVFEYDHPVFNQAAISAQKHLIDLQGKHGLYFAGAYTGYGFHEDGLRSAVAIAKYFGVTLPWQKNTPVDEEPHHA